MSAEENEKLKEELYIANKIIDEMAIQFKSVEYEV